MLGSSSQLLICTVFTNYLLIPRVSRLSIHVLCTHFTYYGEIWDASALVSKIKLYNLINNYLKYASIFKSCPQYFRSKFYLENV